MPPELHREGLVVMRTVSGSQVTLCSAQPLHVHMTYRIGAPFIYWARDGLVRDVEMSNAHPERRRRTIADIVGGTCVVRR